MLNDSPALPLVTLGKSAHISEPKCPGSLKEAETHLLGLLES